METMCLPAPALTSSGLAEGIKLPGFSHMCAVHTLNLLSAGKSFLKKVLKVPGT